MGGDAAAALRARAVDQGARIGGRGCIATRSGGRCAQRRAAGLSRARRRASKLDPFKDEIHRLLREDPKLPGQRVRELIAPLGFDGGKTIVDDYLREVRPLFAPPPRTFQRTVYRPGEICQFDLWEPRAEVPVGHGQTRRGWVVVACLGYSRAGAGALIFSKQTPDLLAGIARCLWSLGALPQTLVWDRQAGLHARGGRPTEEFAAFCGAAAGRLALLRAARSAGQGRRRAPAGLHGDATSSPAARFANELDFQLQLDALVRQARQRRARTRRCAAGRSTGSLEEREVMAPLPGRAPDTDRRWVLRVPPDPHLRFDTNDYSLDPRAGRPARRGPRHRARGHRGRAGHRRARLPPRRGRSRKHRTITALEHARALRERRAASRDDEPTVEVRPLARYDALIA